MLGVDPSARVPSAFPFCVTFFLFLVRYTTLLTGADLLYYCAIFFMPRKGRVDRKEESDLRIRLCRLGRGKGGCACLGLCAGQGQRGLGTRTSQFTLLRMLFKHCVGEEMRRELSLLQPRKVCTSSETIPFESWQHFFSGRPHISWHIFILGKKYRCKSLNG